jgi:hypothetical protein
MHKQPTEPHLAVRQTLALAILNSRAAITDLALIRSAESIVSAGGPKLREN